MRLIDAEIEKRALKNAHECFWSLEMREMYEEGLKEARDFYENQKCETCRFKDTCPINKLVQNPINSFGCNKWEPNE